MKIRNGFVSNSSTSSFICDFCGYGTADRDLCLDDIDMIECEHGHVICKEHLLKSYDIDSKDFAIDFLQLLDRQAQNGSPWTKEYAKKHSEEIKPHLEDEDFSLTNYLDYYDIKDYGVPEDYCPVCARLKEMQDDPEYVEYNRLFEKFKHVKPNGCTADVNME